MGRIDKIKEKMQILLEEDYLEESADRYNRFYIRIPKTRIKEISQLFVEELKGRLVAISANDEGVEGFDLVYHFDFSHQEKRLHICIKTRLSRKAPLIASITEIAWSANWAERELMDLMGIKFEGHPDPRKLFLPFAWPSEEIG